MGGKDRTMTAVMGNRGGTRWQGCRDLQPPLEFQVPQTYLFRPPHHADVPTSLSAFILFFSPLPQCLSICLPQLLVPGGASHLPRASVECKRFQVTTFPQRAGLSVGDPESRSHITQSFSTVISSGNMRRGVSDRGGGEEYK